MGWPARLLRRTTNSEAAARRRVALRSISTTMAAVLIGCAPDADPPSAPRAAANLNPLQAGVPERGAETRLPQWSTQPDSMLFAHTATLDTVFAVGIKAPGARRGVYRGRWLVDLATWRNAHSSLAGRNGIRLVAIDTLLPIVRLKIPTVEALAAIRKLPFVDYVEPAYFPAANLYDDSGCDYPTWSGYTDTGPYPYSDMQPDTYRMMNIDRAWSATTGEGVWIGLTDTGVNLWDIGNSEFGSWFSSGAVSSRQFRQTSTTGGEPGVACSHGTRMAGVVAAPLNGRSVVGVAYGANLYSVYANDRVWDSDGVDQQQAVRDAGNGGSRVILMAWGVPYFHQSLNDEIDYWYGIRDVLFVGAAGTSNSNLSQNNVIFPAEKSDVIAASAANRDGTRMSDSHYGPELDLIAYANQPTTAAGGGTASISSSSNATAVIGGVAALVRARFPTWTNAQVTDRLIQMSDTTCGMPKAFHRLVNAAAAVSGFCVSSLHGPNAIRVGGTTPESQQVTVWFNVTVRSGVGPYTYRWVGSNSTGSSAPITFWSYGGAPQTYTTSVTVSITDEGSSLPPALRTETRTLYVTVVDDGYWDPDNCAPPRPC